jgi:hypothetical protein
MKEGFSSGILWIKFARMRICTWAFLCLVGILLQPFAYARQQGSLEGRLVNETNPSSAPSGVPVDVITLSSGMRVLKSSVTDGSGRFVIDGLPVDTPLLVRATYQSVSYYGQPSFDTAGKADLEIPVFEGTSTFQGIRLESLQMAFKLSGNSLQSLESYRIVNESKPPRSVAKEDGTFRFSKAPGILEMPGISVTGPGNSMPVTQPPLESADGESYYSLYPLRPGITEFDVQQILPYQGGSYTYKKKFYQDVSSLNIGVIPRDMAVSGEGLKQVQVDAEKNFAVYSSGPIKAGTEVVWTFSGGTPLLEAPAAPPPQDFRIVTMPAIVVQDAMLIGPLMLIGFLLVLWYAHRRGFVASTQTQEARLRELRERREQILNHIAALDARYENRAIERREYLRLRELGKRHLRRIAMLLAER